MLICEGKKYGNLGIFSRKSATAGNVVSNATESNKKVSRSWVRIWRKELFCTFLRASFNCNPIRERALDSVPNETLLWLHKPFSNPNAHP